jgi:hypothetical protein
MDFYNIDIYQTKYHVMWYPSILFMRIELKPD